MLLLVKGEIRWQIKALRDQGTDVEQYRKDSEKICHFSGLIELLFTSLQTGGSKQLTLMASIPCMKSHLCHSLSIGVLYVCLIQNTQTMK